MSAGGHFIPSPWAAAVMKARRDEAQRVMELVDAFPDESKDDLAIVAYEDSLHRALHLFIYGDED